MILLNGVVTFAGTLISWKIENKNKDFFILFFLLTGFVLTGTIGHFASIIIDRGANPHVAIVGVPSLPFDVSDLEALRAIADQITGEAPAA